MGNSLSQDSQAILDAATAGDALLLKQQIECEPKLLESVTLVKRRGVLHLAAKQGHPQVISTVLDPLLDAVRQEYHVSVWHTHCARAHVLWQWWVCILYRSERLGQKQTGMDIHWWQHLCLAQLP